MGQTALMKDGKQWEMPIYILLRLVQPYHKTKSPTLNVGLFVIPPRFERGTHSLEGCCSIQLSYGTSLFVVRGAKILKNRKLQKGFLQKLRSFSKSITLLTTTTLFYTEMQYSQSTILLYFNHINQTTTSKA